MIKVFYVIISLVGIAFVFAACTQNDIIDKDKMSKVYVDILIIKEQYILNADSLNVYQKRIFEKYGITKKAYEATLKSYKFDKDIWKDFFKKVYARIDTLKTREKDSHKKIKSQLKIN